MPLHTLRTQIAGLSHRSAAEREAFAAVAQGDTFYLKPEPENPYDKNAVKVIAILDDDSAPGEFHVGYIPRQQAPRVLEWMQDDNLEVSCIKVHAGWNPILLLEAEALASEEGSAA